MAAPLAPYLRPHSVLVIEPDVRARREIADVLLVNGLLVLCSVGAREALELLRDGLTPDALVFDARLSIRELTLFGLSHQPTSLPAVAVVPPNRRWPGSPDVATRVTCATLHELPAALSETIRRHARD